MRSSSPAAWARASSSAAQAQFSRAGVRFHAARVGLAAAKPRSCGAVGLGYRLLTTERATRTSLLARHSAMSGLGCSSPLDMRPRREGARPRPGGSSRQVTVLSGCRSSGLCRPSLREQIQVEPARSPPGDATEADRRGAKTEEAGRHGSRRLHAGRGAIRRSRRRAAE